MDFNDEFVGDEPDGSPAAAACVAEMFAPQPSPFEPVVNDVPDKIQLGFDPGDIVTMPLAELVPAFNRVETMLKRIRAAQELIALLYLYRTMLAREIETKMDGADEFTAPSGESVRIVRRVIVGK